MRLAIQPLPLLRYRAHPPHLRPIYIHHLKLFPLLLQLLRHSLNINPQIVPQKLANFSILVIPCKRRRNLAIRRVYIHVRSGVAMGTPACLAATRHHVCVLVERGLGVLGEACNFGVAMVFDAETFGDGLFDK